RAWRRAGGGSPDARPPANEAAGYRCLHRARSVSRSLERKPLAPARPGNYQRLVISSRAQSSAERGAMSLTASRPNETASSQPAAAASIPPRGWAARKAAELLAEADVRINGPRAW